MSRSPVGNVATVLSAIVGNRDCVGARLILIVRLRYL
jgi:hypothetical protein